MASDYIPPQPNGVSSNESGDPTRLHPALSNTSTSIDGRYQKPRGASQPQHEPFPSERYQQARQPINDAVVSAINTSDASSATAFSPQFLQHITSQITANVLQQLKASNWAPPNQQSQMPGSQGGASSWTAGSPPLDRAAVYTPPSPYRTSEDFGMIHSSPQLHSQSTRSSFRATSPPADKRAISPFSQGSHISESDTNQDRPVRPKGPKRMSTSGDATILERVWGPLFDEQGEGTPRLGQFLRGIAVHLIEDYEPKNSLVITPTKMQRYYDETKLSREIYPWQIVFDDRTSSISRMFREIGAQHHLVQEKLYERPDIPGLTPHGFETWATLLLKAHPDQEFERLAKTALDMPISNPDEKKERFPKELSRRLFPGQGDLEIVQKLQKAISTHCNVSFSSRHGSAADSNTKASQPSQPVDDPLPKTNLKPPLEKQDPVTNVMQPSPALSHANLERQRQPYSGAPTDPADDAIEDNVDVPTQPIERERKPYVAAPGGGKSYDNIDSPVAAPDVIFAPLIPPPAPPAHEPKRRRSSSFHAASRPSDLPKSKTTPIAIHQRPPPPPLDIPETRLHRSNSTHNREQHRLGRNRSPSMTKESGAGSFVRRSDTDGPYLTPSHPTFTGTEHFDEARRHREYEAQRERLANDRYDPARMAAYDPRERERERERDNRPRMQSISAFDGASSSRTPVYPASAPSVDEDYYRSRAHTGSASSHNTPSVITTGFAPPAASSRDPGYGSYPPSAGYPPNSYREAR